MADVVSTIDSVDAIAKDNQTAAAVEKQYDFSSVLLEKASVTGRKGTWKDGALGRQYVLPIETEPQNAYTRFASDSAPDASAKTRKVAYYDPRGYITSKTHWDFDVDARATGTGPSEAFIDDVADGLAGVGEAIGKETVRQALQGRADGCLALTETSTNYIVFSAADWERLIDREVITIGLKLDVFTATASVVDDAAAAATARAVTAIDKDNLRITVDGGTLGSHASTTRAIAIAGNRQYDGSATTIREITSIPTICDETAGVSVGSLSSTNTRRWIGNEYDYQNADFSTAAYAEQLEEIERRCGDVPSNMHVFADRKRLNSALFAMSANQVQYSSTSQVEGVMRKEIPLQDGTVLTRENQTAPGEIVVLSLANLEFVSPRGEKVSWAPGYHRNGICRYDGDYGFEAMGFWNGDLVTNKRGAHSRGYDCAN